MRKRKGHDKHENHERWLVSYADFITLLFAFFVVMYSVSSVNEGKYRVLSDSIALAFRATPISIQPIQTGGIAGNAPSQPDFGRPQPAQIVAPDLRPMPTAIIQRAPQQLFFLNRPHTHSAPETPLSKQPGPSSTNTRGGGPNENPDSEDPLVGNFKNSFSIHGSNEHADSKDPLDQVIDRLRGSLPELINANLVQIRRTQFWVEIEIKNNILFTSGSAVINEQARETLGKIATILHDIPNRLRVEGFTDDVPISTPIYPSNWELSAARAASVVHLLMQHGVRPERMAAIGYGEYQPIDNNATEQGRMRNRRVVLVILSAKENHRQAHEAPEIATLNSHSIPSKPAEVKGNPSINHTRFPDE
jgi:chemotaxis protein MotB